MSTASQPDRQSRIAIIPSSPVYAEQMEDLGHTSYGTSRENPDQVFTAAMFRQHVNVFPEGQFTAIDTTTDSVVGLTVSMRMDFDPTHHHTEQWWSSIGYGWLTTHVPDGEWMYGVESCVHPDWRGRGVGSRLMDARFNVLRRLNLRGMIAGSSIVDYHKVAHLLSVEEYIVEVQSGRLFDTNLTKQLHKGFKACYPIPDYVDDGLNRGYGVLIMWENSDYHPTRSFHPVAKLPVPAWLIGISQ